MNQKYLVGNLPKTCHINAMKPIRCWQKKPHRKETYYTVAFMKSQIRQKESLVHRGAWRSSALAGVSYIDLSTVTQVGAVVQIHHTGPLKWCTSGVQVTLQHSTRISCFIVVSKRSEVCTVLMEGRPQDMLSIWLMFSSLLLVLLVHTTILRKVCCGGRQMAKAVILLVQGGDLTVGRGQLQWGVFFPEVLEHIGWKFLPHITQLQVCFRKDQIYVLK